VLVITVGATTTAPTARVEVFVVVVAGKNLALDGVAAEATAAATGNVAVDSKVETVLVWGTNA